MKRENSKNKTKSVQTNKKHWLISVSFIALVTFILYAQTFRFDFVNWDDQVNVFENQSVVDFNVKGIFTEHVIGNYNPLSNLTLSVEYQLVKDDASLYHFNNVLLHVLCTMLVFFLVKRLELSLPVAFLTALLFGIHPMHVESVAWITERKDVLFGMFYLVTLLLYISFRKTKKPVYFILSLLTFSLSLLSKIQAVSLPFSLLLIDFWFEKNISIKQILQKAPYFLMALITGLIGIYFLRKQGSLDTGDVIPISQRLFIGSYSYVVYIIKSIVPYQMSALYPFPAKLSFIHYGSLFPGIALFIVSILFYKTYRIITFGFLFFTLNIVFVLQVIGAGQGFLADRFTYIPYIGLFLILAVLFENLLIKYARQKTILYTFLAVYLLIITVQTHNQISTWKNSETLWTDVIAKQPAAVLAYNNLAYYYVQNNQHQKALINYNKAIELNPQKAESYNNRGKVYFEIGNFEKALEDYNKSLSINPGYTDALANRGAVYGATKEFEKAIPDLSRVIDSDRTNIDAISNRGFIFYQLKDYGKAINDFNLFLQLKNNDAEIINLLALSYAGLTNFDQAITYYNQAIRINPTNPIYFINRSYSHNSKGELKEALNDAMHAQKMGLNVDEAYIRYLNQNIQQN